MEQGRPQLRLPTAGPVTKRLCMVLGIGSLLFKLSEKYIGFGTADLTFSIAQVFDLQLWRLITYAFVEVSAFSLIISVIIVYLFGATFEARWGGRDFLKFYMTSVFGAAVLAIPLSYVFNAVLPFPDMLAMGGATSGPSPAIDALLVAMALMAPDSNILFGFILPMRVRTAIYVMIGLQVVFGIMNGAAELSLTAGGLLMGYFLVTGMWRPSRWLDRWRLSRYRKRRGPGLHVVPPAKDKTLH